MAMSDRESIRFELIKVALQNHSAEQVWAEARQGFFERLTWYIYSGNVQTEEEDGKANPA